MLGWRFGSLFLLGVEEVEFLAGLEADGLAGGDSDLGSGAGIAADSGFARADVEDAKSSQLDAVASGEGLLEALKNRVYRRLRLIARQARTLDDVMDNVLFYQRVHLFLPGLGRQFSRLQGY